MAAFVLRTDQGFVAKWVAGFETISDRPSPSRQPKWHSSCEDLESSDWYWDHEWRVNETVWFNLSATDWPGWDPGRDTSEAYFWITPKIFWESCRFLDDSFEYVPDLPDGFVFAAESIVWYNGTVAEGGALLTRAGSIFVDEEGSEYTESKVA